MLQGPGKGGCTPAAGVGTIPVMVDVGVVLRASTGVPVGVDAEVGILSFCGSTLTYATSHTLPTLFEAQSVYAWLPEGEMLSTPAGLRLFTPGTSRRTISPAPFTFQDRVVIPPGSIVVGFAVNSSITGGFNSSNPLVAVAAFVEAIFPASVPEAEVATNW